MALLIMLMISFTLFACGGGSNTKNQMATQPAVSGADQAAPSMDELTSFLADELERLGVDPDKAVASAPTGTGNAVFDLTAIPTKETDEYGKQSVVVELTWTEVLIGDYNQDGLVTSTDLTQLGQHWLKQVEYDDPALHDGIAYWPAGDPDGAGAANWRLARVDGNRNGLIELADITTIAQHWEERTRGYLVYRIGPDDEKKLLTGDRYYYGNLTVQHYTPSTGGVPVRFSYVDEFEEGGTFTYYAVPFDTTSWEAGPESNRVSTVINLNRKPVAVLTATPQTGKQPLDVLFDAASSSDSDGEIVLYELDLDDDGVYEEMDAPQATHQFVTAGTYPVSLRVTDDTGDQGLAEVTIQVQTSNTPSAVLEATPTSGLAELLVEFNASASVDIDGEIVLYEFDFDGDGEFDFSGESATTSYLYQRAGHFSARLQVTDNAGLVMATSVEIEIFNQPPVADIVADKTSGKPPLSVRFDAEESTDPDGEIVRYDFDWEGDGVWDEESFSPIQLHGFNDLGTFQTFVRVTDNLGAKSTASVEIVVALPPEAVIRMTSSYGKAPVHATFDPFMSSSGSGSVVAFEWDWESDGVVDLVTDEAEYVSHVFDTPGMQQISLRIVDDTGLSGSDDISFEVLESDGEPDWRYIVLDNGYLPCALKISDVPAVCYLQYDGVNESVWFKRALDTKGIYWADAVLVSDCLFTDLDLQKIELALIQGVPAICFPRENPATGLADLVYTRAEDANGSTWCEPVVLASSMSEDIYSYSLAEIDGGPAVAYSFGSADPFVRLAADSAGNTWNDSVQVHGGYPGPAKDISLVEADGRPAISWANYRIIYVIADDALGTTWGSPQQFSTGNYYYHTDMCIVAGHPALAMYEWGDIIGDGKDLWYMRAVDPSGSSWNSPVKISDSADEDDAGRYPSLTVVGGKPAVAYWTGLYNGSESYYFAAAVDSLGATWYEPEEIPGGLGVRMQVTSLIDTQDAIPGLAMEYISFSTRILWAVKY